MAAKPSLGSCPRLLLPLFLLFCLGLVFYSYFKPTLSISSCSEVAESTYEVCIDKCFGVFNKIFNRNVTSISSFNYTQQQIPTTKQILDRDTIILAWTWPFGFRFDEKACGPYFDIEGCRVTDNRLLYGKAHGVMFHHRDLGDDLPNLLSMPRPPHQKWVWMNMESPENSERWTDIDGLFNLTASYRRDSDVWVPYGRILPTSVKNETFKIPPKDKLVCWIVSNWNPHYRRVEYFNELSKHIKIEGYGRHFNRYINDEDYVPTLSSCKFYLSFESSIHEDYVTEKLFNPLISGTVPVVLGPPRENYEEFIPADSFIHVDDFKSPQELAEHLKFLDQNQEVYERYFTWRQAFTAKGSYFGLEHACYICDYIKKHKDYRVFKSLSKWYWG
ncbi:4-galactosyl-N-acetylglucosaminide 3-alpha-L-fucosyltransferase 9-like [Hemibagrus wyckioides]|uniref:4-galactosyl-N-acetylglucosaminide 3-alpha-L-fucosyltransferase 9-like n=1 Tax=Hemibagrus wyckioides TaxID=337641 RepID=UPI00266D9158|nr:4-galactosyl-N-acetylglucosaminide 3-alpha-L-fucosyltransferase 9-like [Hemibagrus wyckioides]XP_058263883.1 4-galactosyl-N-acetylglucosaminide 3-alpha-L-fucosyltransferase 9-like [Hemibagrus wyckioides]XP_058263884.1 4-galactosyl-N-acetylglucosaminide 3-alpha-L-fucosyltransferase 9-like [Hemibagrus wyckioides]XP_058263885.1 4-galactosyl-N-acetylglucosaminide 3-alpha-L-fucosyltransferase 9-like [Hemibagrus wyckioides]XP_058263886.1 4-galactosyl-N-acetylglucosaminide 3-alpha-L-fucosyltransfer